MRMRWVGLCCAAVTVALPSEAQTDSARIATLEARIAKLEVAMGPYGDSIPPASNFEVVCPLLPNQRYSVWCRVQQIGLGIDENNKRVDSSIQALAGIQTQVSGLATRVAAVESRSGLGRTIRADSLVLGSGCPTDASAILQLCGPGGVSIAGFSNLSGSWYQSPRPHAFTIDFSGDGGGPRLIQNGYGTYNCVPAVDPTNGQSYTKCLKDFVDNSRPYTAIGTDSWGNWSVLRAMPGEVREYTQNAVLVINPDNKTISWESWQSGWRWVIAASTCRTCADLRYPVPQQ